MSQPRIIQVNATDAARLRKWLDKPNGSLKVGTVTVEAVEGGGLLIRALPEGWE